MSRIEETRDTKTREAEAHSYAYQAPTQLAMPKLDGDWHLRWVRVTTGRGGEDDLRSITRRKNEGYEFVRASECKGQFVPQHQKGSRFEGVVGYHDVVLMKLPKYKAEARNKFYGAAVETKTRSIEEDMFKERHPSMPLERDKSSRENVTRGQAPEFDTD